MSNRRRAFEIPEGTGDPDGCAIDVNDNVWVAHWGGSRVTCFDSKTGKELARVELPTKLITACAFGGPEMKDLYITSASCELSEEEKKADAIAGGVFRVRNVGVAGAKPTEFRG